MCGIKIQFSALKWMIKQHILASVLMCYCVIITYKLIFV